jgi:hypothetical protein
MLQYPPNRGENHWKYLGMVQITDLRITSEEYPTGNIKGWKETGEYCRNNNNNKL